MIALGAFAGLLNCVGPVWADLDPALKAPNPDLRQEYFRAGGIDAGAKTSEAVAPYKNSLSVGFAASSPRLVSAIVASQLDRRKHLGKQPEATSGNRRQSIGGF
jgi:hypothetical protein